MVWFMSRKACVMPRGSSSMRMKVTWFTWSLRNLLPIRLRALYSARSVRADRPLTPMVFW